MKKLILLGLIMGLFNACTECPAERFTTTSANIDDTKQLVVDYNNGDWDAWLTHYAEDATVAHNTNTGVSPQEIVVGLKDILANCSSYGWADEPLFYEQIVDDKGDTWVYRWALWQGELKANGQKLEIPVHIALKYENGKIAEEYGFYNLAEFTAAMAAIQTEAEAAAEGS